MVAFDPLAADPFPQADNTTVAAAAVKKTPALALVKYFEEINFYFSLLLLLSFSYA